MLRFFALIGLSAFACSLLVAVWLFEVALPGSSSAARDNEASPETVRDSLYQARDANELVRIARARSVDTAVSFEIAVIAGAAIAAWVPFARRQLRNEG